MNLLKRILLGGEHQPENQNQHIYAHKSWVVRWQSRKGEYSSDTRPEAEVFPIYEDAVAFKQALENAFKLIRHTSGNRVVLEENQ